MAKREERATVIVLGGCGFIGRNMVEFLISSDLVSRVRVVDKVPPQTAWLNKCHQAIFDDPRVEFRSANLINPASCDSVFGDGPFEVAVNCAGETKPGQTDPIYEEGIVRVSLNCARAAASHHVCRYVEVSSGQMASAEKVSHRECDKTKPWTSIARFKLQVEEQLKGIAGLHCTVVRPAIVYGPGDRDSLTPRIVIGGLYRLLGESMKLMWSMDLAMDTVHVTDLCRAIWHVCHNGDGGVYNVADLGGTTQETVASIISQIFGIEHSYWGNVVSTLAKVDMSGVVEEVNDKHLGPWAAACTASRIENTPLSPYIHAELLYNRHTRLDQGRLLATGFSFRHANITHDLVQQVIDDYVEMGLFPRSLLP